MATKPSSSSDWSFNLRTGKKAGYDSDDSDLDGNADFANTDPTSEETRQLNDMDISSREESVVYKPNPFSIAKINAASRSVPNPLSAIASTTASTAPIACSAATGTRPNNSRTKTKGSTNGNILDGFRKQSERGQALLPNVRRGVAAQKKSSQPKTLNVQNETPRTLPLHRLPSHNDTQSAKEIHPVPTGLHHTDLPSKELKPRSPHLPTPTTIISPRSAGQDGSGPYIAALPGTRIPDPSLELHLGRDDSLISHAPILGAGAPSETFQDSHSRSDSHAGTNGIHTSVLENAPPAHQNNAHIFNLPSSPLSALAHSSPIRPFYNSKSFFGPAKSSPVHANAFRSSPIVPQTRRVAKKPAGRDRNLPSYPLFAQNPIHSSAYPQPPAQLRPAPQFAPQSAPRHTNDELVYFSRTSDPNDYRPPPPASVSINPAVRYAAPRLSSPHDRVSSPFAYPDEQGEVHPPSSGRITRRPSPPPSPHLPPRMHAKAYNPRKRAASPSLPSPPRRVQQKRFRTPMKAKDAYDNTYMDPDEEWGTLPSRKKNRNDSSASTHREKPRLSSTFCLPNLVGGKTQNAKKSGISATSSKRVIVFLPPPLAPAAQDLESGTSLNDHEKRGAHSRNEHANPYPSPSASKVSPPRPACSTQVSEVLRARDDVTYRPPSPPTSDPPLMLPALDEEGGRDDVYEKLDIEALSVRYADVRRSMRERRRRSSMVIDLLGLQSCGVVYRDCERGEGSGLEGYGEVKIPIWGDLERDMWV